MPRTGQGEREMTLVVTVTTARLRDGLLDVLADVVGGLHDSLLPVSAQPNARSAQTHYVKARAIGDLLDEIGWTAGQIAAPYQLDIAVHGWAATTALQRVIAREYFCTWQNAEIEEAEASGQAGGFRDDAEHDLGVIQQACESARFKITPPTP